MRVTIFQRYKPGAFSLESIAKNLSENLPHSIATRIYSSKLSNAGVFSRFLSLFDAIPRQGDVNHVLGDVHFLAILMKKKQTVLTMADCELLTQSSYGPMKIFLYRLFWFWLPARRCKIITTISHEAKKSLKSIARIRKEVRVVYPGVSDTFRQVKIEPSEKKSLLKNQKNLKTVLHVSDFRENKNFDRLLMAIQPLEVKLIKIGILSKKQLRLLIDLGIDYSHFQELPLDQLVKIYNSVDVLAFPSLTEGFGLPVVEAQKCGCPVVTSQTSSLPEIAGEGARFVNPYEVESIRAGIKEVLNQEKLRKLLIIRGLENARRFSVKNASNQFLSIYQEVVS